MVSEYDIATFLEVNLSIIKSSYSDPLPFQWLAKETLVDRNFLFADVDYPQLMKSKIEIVKSTSELLKVLDRPDFTGFQRDVFCKSTNYIALGCDLADIARLQFLLQDSLAFSECMVLCTAEVSITYMNVEAAENLIRWAAQHGDSTYNAFIIEKSNVLSSSVLSSRTDLA